MRLDELTIAEFKNLRNVTITFDEPSPYTVLVGENGAGKSNLIEALSLIFRNLDLEWEAPFAYSLTYRCRRTRIRVVAQRESFPKFHVATGDDAGSYKEISRKEFMSDDSDGRPRYRPAFVFGYYSGPSDRLASLYEKHRERYYNWIIKPVASRAKTVLDPNSLRRLFYAQTVHGQFALLAFFMAPGAESDSDQAFLREHLQIEGLDSVLFALKRPPWRRTGGDPRFWNAEGDVRNFLSCLYGEALAPIRMDRRIALELTKNPPIESLYLFLPTPDALARVYRSYNDQYAFFTALESTHLSKLLGEVRTRVRMTPEAGGRPVTYRDLSEGEQQLLLVLGLLRFTARDEALFLLDEPDTHLNPAWSTQYLDFLDRFIHNKETCHIVMSTHDPLVFAGLERTQVRIFRRDAAANVVVEIPDQSPRGMGVAAILTSDLFRLRSTLDAETQQDLDRQRILTMKAELTADQQLELRQIKERLRGRGFSASIRDPLYELFVKAWTEREDPSWTEAVQLTDEQRRRRAELASDIVAQLRREQGTS